MKRSGFVILLLIFIFSNSMLAQNQNGNPNAKKMSFYMQLAQKDAAYEQSWAFNSEKDELDFWKDQKRYELDLMESNEAAYQTYMKEKIAAYRRHFLTCSFACPHTKQNLERAKEYLSQSIYGYDMEISVNGIVENLQKNTSE